MKKLKLNLDELKVQSFVTSLDDRPDQTVHGGTGPINPSAVDGCRSALFPCDPIPIFTNGGCNIPTRNCSWNDGCGSALGCNY